MFRGGLHLKIIMDIIFLKSGIINGYPLGLRHGQDSRRLCVLLCCYFDHRNTQTNLWILHLQHSGIFSIGLVPASIIRDLRDVPW